MAKYPKGHYSKAARHARKMEACGRCAAQAEKILQGRPRKPRAPRVPRRGGMYGPRGAPKSTRVAIRTMTDDQILSAGRSMAAKMSARIARRKARWGAREMSERGMMGGNDMRA